jgi:hypothetical protein
MKTVLFVNFSDEAFTGMWDSQSYPFAPGQTMYMEDWKARHFAKHLVNRELLKDGQETHTSPKEKNGVIDDVLFMELFNKAVIDSEPEEVPESMIETEVINKNAKAKKAVKKSKPEPEAEFEGVK